MICLVAALTPIRKLAEMVNIGTLLAFVIVCAAVLILRVRRPDAHRPFRCPALFVVAPLGIVVNLTLMLFLPRRHLAAAGGLAGDRLCDLLRYSRRHSRLGQHLLRELTSRDLAAATRRWIRPRERREAAGTAAAVSSGRRSTSAAQAVIGARAEGQVACVRAHDFADWLISDDAWLRRPRVRRRCRLVYSRRRPMANPWDSDEGTRP